MSGSASKRSAAARTSRAAARRSLAHSATCIARGARGARTSWTRSRTATGHAGRAITRTNARPREGEGAWTRERRLARVRLLPRVLHPATRAPGWALPAAPDSTRIVPWRPPVRGALAKATDPTRRQRDPEEVGCVKTVPLFTPQRTTILNIIHRSPGLSVRDIARRIGLDESSADYHLHQLERAGLIVRRRRGRALAHYPPGVSA